MWTQGSIMWTLLKQRETKTCNFIINPFTATYMSPGGHGWPQVHTSPSSVNTTECVPPAATCTICTLLSWAQLAKSSYDILLIFDHDNIMEAPRLCRIIVIPKAPSNLTERLRLAMEIVCGQILNRHKAEIELPFNHTWRTRKRGQHRCGMEMSRCNSLPSMWRPNSSAHCPYSFPPAQVHQPTNPWIH